jgi:hypothetical protein
VTWQWYAGGAVVPNATTSSLVLTSAEAGKTITVKATGHAAGFTDQTGESAPTAAVLEPMTAGTVTISGQPHVGSTLTAVSITSTWAPAGVTLSYQWLRDGTAITGETSSTYVPVNGDVGHDITVSVTGALAGYVPATAVSSAAHIVAASTPPSAVTAGSVSISGPVEVGSTLTAALSGWGPAGVAYAYQWNRDTSPIGGATAATYVPVLDDVTHTLSVTVTGSHAGYNPTAQTSANTVAVPKPTVTKGTVSITGTPVVGGTLTAHQASWGPSGVSLAYEWRRSGSPLAGATSATYQPVAADVGHTLTVAVTGTMSGYNPDIKESAATAAVQDAVSAVAYEAFVKASYQDFLGRAPSADELTAQSTALSQGRVSRSSYLDSLSRSDEWLSTIVTKMYKDTLQRNPDAAGLAGWVKALRSGQWSVAQVASYFYASPEYYQNFAGNAPTPWVTQLYQKLLNRDPDAPGLAQWVQQTNDPRYGRMWVAANFYQSTESRTRRVEALYQALLFREPDSTGWPYWTNTVWTTGDLVLATQIAGSQEYWDKAHVRF